MNFEKPAKLGYNVKIPPFPRHLSQDPSEKVESWPKIYCNSTENGNICWVGNGDGDPKPKGPPESHWVPEGDIRELGGVFYWVF